MKKINYNAHLLLQSKYKILITLLIYFTIYISFYSQNITHCMNENSNIIEIPPIAEVKEYNRPSHQVLALKKEIMDFAGIHFSLLDQIERQNQIIAEQKAEIQNFNFLIYGGSNETLTEYYNGGGYIKRLDDMGSQLRRLESKLNITNILLEQAKRDNENLSKMLARR